MPDVSQILEAINRGDQQAAKDLLPLVYNQLRALAAERLAQEAPGQTLQATALVHEAYLRMTSNGGQQSSEETIVPDRPDVKFANRAHFFASAAESMRRILIEIARRKKRRQQLVVDHRPMGAAHDSDQLLQQLDLIDLDEALTELARFDARKAKLVELRFFAGLSDVEVAECLGVSVATIKRDWAFSKAWLFQRLHLEPEPAQNVTSQTQNKSIKPEI